MKVAEMKSRITFCAPASVIASIVEQVAEKHGIGFGDIVSRDKRRAIAWARHEAWDRIYRETNMSLPAIGDWFNVDHTSVLYGIWAHRKRKQQGKVT